MNRMNRVLMGACLAVGAYPSLSFSAGLFRRAADRASAGTVSEGWVARWTKETGRAVDLGIAPATLSDTLPELAPFNPKDPAVIELVQV